MEASRYISDSDEEKVEGAINNNADFNLESCYLKYEVNLYVINLFCG